MLTSQNCLNLDRYATQHYSQCGEDGILEQILSLVGATNRTAVEFGGGDGYNLSNTRRFADLGWRVVMFDGAHEGDLVHRRLITAENINELFREFEIPYELDLLSIDIDGNDFWVWQALEYRPRVLVIEFNGCLAAAERKTIPYDPGFVHDGTNYYGASFALLCDLGRARGYVPIFQLHSLNLFFVRTHLFTGSAPSLTYKQAHYHPPDPGGRPWVTPGYPL